jgi:hypothetical protein
MTRSFTIAAAVVFLLGGSLLGQEAPPAAAATKSKMTTQELADWIDARFAKEYEAAGVKPADVVDDASFLRRVYLDLQGRIPTVAQLRDFTAAENSFKRPDYVDRLLNDERRPDRFAQRSADHLGRVWRRMMVPASAVNAGMATQLDPWLSRQFSLNTPYDQFARKLLLATPQQPMPMLGGAPATTKTPDPDAAAAIFQQAIGASPENLTGAYVRVFLGVRINCAVSAITRWPIGSEATSGDRGIPGRDHNHQAADRGSDVHSQAAVERRASDRHSRGQVTP